MTTLENLWYGNIRPVESFVDGNTEYKSLLRLVGKNREKLEATLSPEQTELFEKYESAVRGHGRGRSVLLRIPARRPADDRTVWRNQGRSIANLYQRVCPHFHVRAGVYTHRKIAAKQNCFAAMCIMLRFGYLPNTLFFLP